MNYIDSVSQAAAPTLFPDPQVALDVVFSNTQLCHLALKIYLTG
jgi:hypothetical protein